MNASSALSNLLPVKLYTAHDIFIDEIRVYCHTNFSSCLHDHQFMAKTNEMAFDGDIWMISIIVGIRLPKTFSALYLQPLDFRRHFQLCTFVSPALGLPKTSIITVCVFVRHLFSFYPFYFDFYSARIIFDVSSGFYLWNINKTTAWHL